jgi:pyruvate carboxylase
MSNLGLGANFDIGSVIVPVDIADGTNTGHRIHLKNYGAVTFVGYITTGTSAENPVFDLKEANALTGGTSQDLDIIDEYWKKEEAILDGDETWTRVTQTAASEVTDATWDDANQVIVAFKVRAEQLSDGYEWVSVDVASLSTAHIGCVFAIMHNLKVQRSPQNLVQPNA